ncbi:unnamed protein product [Umbelopsis ramanniana]
MLTLTLLFLLCVIAFAQAAVIKKRVTAQVNAYNASQGYPNLLRILNNLTTLETDANTATTDCNAINGTVSDDDATAVFAEVALLVPQVQAALQASINKKPVFDTILLGTGLFNADLDRLQTSIASLEICLLNHTPTDQVATAQGYITQINTAFTAACSAYGSTC